MLSGCDDFGFSYFVGKKQQNEKTSMREFIDCEG